MCMSYDHPKPIRMHALTLFNDMRRPKLPQRPRGSPGAFTFFKIFEHTRTNQYTPLAALSELVVRKAPAPDAPVRTPAQNWSAPAPPPGDNSLPRQFVSPDLSGNFVSPGIFFCTICVTRVAALLQG